MDRVELSFGAGKWRQWVRHGLLSLAMACGLASGALLPAAGGLDAAAQAIEVRALNGEEVANFGEIDLGTRLEAGVTTTVNITIKNVGTADLVVNGIDTGRALRGLYDLGHRQCWQCLQHAVCLAVRD